MSAVAGEIGTAASADDALPLSLRGPAPVNVVAAFGFWLFLLSDIILFATLFAAYAVLSGNSDGGPSGSQLFDTRDVFIETLVLLLSSFTCGLGLIGAQRQSIPFAATGAVLTFGLGLMFMALELGEFARLVEAGAGPSRSAFLSAFFTLVGTHGLHVSLGLAWLVVMAIQVATRGFSAPVMRRLFCFCLFWHALDLVWVGVFTIVYLGART